MNQEIREMFNMVIEEMGRMEDRINRRFDALEARMDKLEARMEAMQHEINANRLEKDTLVIMEKRISRLERTVGLDAIAAGV